MVVFSRTKIFSSQRVKFLALYFFSSMTLKKSMSKFCNRIFRKKNVFFAVCQISRTFNKKKHSRWPWPLWWPWPLTYGHETKPRSPVGVISIITQNMNKISSAVLEEFRNTRLLLADIYSIHCCNDGGAVLHLLEFRLISKLFKISIWRRRKCMHPCTNEIQSLIWETYMELRSQKGFMLPFFNCEVLRVHIWFISVIYDGHSPKKKS